MSKIFYKNTPSLDYTYNTFLVLPGTSSGVFLCSFTTIIDASVGIASASISVVFLVSNGIVEMFLKSMGKKKQTQKNCYIDQK